MPVTAIIYGLAVVGLFALGVRGALLGRVPPINVCGAGAFLVV